MNAAKHTPGPWWVVDRGVRDSGGYICHTLPVTRYEGQEERYAKETSQREADMRLIAAAPDLYAAAQCAANVLALLTPEVDALGLRAGNVREMLRAALAKARGEA